MTSHDAGPPFVGGHNIIPITPPETEVRTVFGQSAPLFFSTDFYMVPYRIIGIYVKVSRFFMPLFQRMADIFGKMRLFCKFLDIHGAMSVRCRGPPPPFRSHQ